MKQKSYGLVKRPPSLLTYQAPRAAVREEAPLPPAWRLPDELMPDVRDQGSVGACVAFAITNVMQILEQKETGTRKQFSPGYAYGRLRTTWRWEGLIEQQALDVLRKSGVCFAEAFPVLEEVPEIIQAVAARPDLEEAAEPYKIAGYVSFADGHCIEDSKRALFTHQVPLLAATGYFGASHEICIVGWDDSKKAFYILNSWGKKWKEQGFGWLPYNEVGRTYMLIDEKNSNALMPFSDVTAGAWYYDAVKNCYNAGLVEGTSETAFEPDRPITRAELCAVMDRLCKKIDAVLAVKENIAKK